MSAQSQNIEQCLSKVQKIFKEDPTHPAINKFLNLQGKLTLHKLAYSFLLRNNFEKTTVKKEIDKILKEINTNDPEFKKVKDQFEKYPLSRTSLAAILPSIQNILNDQISYTDPVIKKKYLINDNDIKLLSIIAEKENTRNLKRASNFNTNRSSNDSIINFAKMIDSSIRNAKNLNKAKTAIKDQLYKLNEELEMLILSLNIDETCMLDFGYCRNQVDIPKLLGEKLFSVIDTFDNYDKHEKLKYGDFFLHTRKIRKDINQTLVEKEFKNKEFKRLPASQEKSELEDLNKIENKFFKSMANKVQSHLPYFFSSQEEVLSDKDLLFSLSQAIDQGSSMFEYKGKSYIIPYAFNRKSWITKGKKVANKGDPKFDQILNKIPQSVIDKLYDIYSALPEQEKKRSVSNELELITYSKLGINKSKIKSSYFVINGHIYNSKTLELLDRVPNEITKFPVYDLNKNSVHGIKKYKQLSPNERRELLLAFDRGEKSFIKETKHGKKVFYLSGAIFNSDHRVKENMKRRVYDLKRKKKDKNFKLIATKALADENPVFIVENKVYNSSTLNQLSHKDIEDKISLNLERLDQDRASKLKSDPNFKAHWATAAINNKTSFEYNGKTYSTTSAQESNRQVRTVNTNDSTYINFDDKQKLIENLNSRDDLNLIKGFHKNFRDDSKCNYYTVVDKQNATSTVYSNDGEVLFSAEVLLGRVKGDHRLKRLTGPGENSKLKTNGQTSAGTFYPHKYREEGIDDDYYRMFNFNLLAYWAEDGHPKQDRENDSGLILATHQIPVTYGYRYAHLDNGTIEDNFITDGCPNMSEKDMDEYEARFKNKNCPTHILPIEEGNRFQIINEKLVFTPKDRSICKGGYFCEEEEDYFYSPIRRKEKKDIKLVVNPNVETNQFTNDFLKTLEDKKFELMKKFNIDNDEYNELAKMAYAILGVESGFTEETRFAIKEGRFATLAGEKAAQFMGQTIVNFGKIFSLNNWGERAANLFTGDFDDNSRSPIQVKNYETYLKNRKEVPDSSKEKLERLYPEITVNSLNQPDHAAIMAIAVLKSINDEMKAISKNHPAINSKTKYKYLYYIYNGMKKDVKRGIATPEKNQKIREIIDYIEDIDVYENQ